ncbi:hypothetical protein NDU88_003757 [Pleurodeles waltl]|uniref:Uncharacterized protein n=1 Tax=Pleurodeles waltl TaxID=8319 RepID=A0AAV7V2P7_PLEWA|nr:hypothetical protein NDU88_003757 [Pleurodeles waltl]
MCQETGARIVEGEQQTSVATQKKEVEGLGGTEADPERQVGEQSKSKGVSEEDKTGEKRKADQMEGKGSKELRIRKLPYMGVTKPLVGHSEDSGRVGHDLRRSEPTG